ncbi:MAG: aspartate kinase [Eubacteriales bacterium]|nr:aspartate kinase [Eubacteriales bacterium]
MGKIVAKFGGSSLSDATQFKKVKGIIEKDERRCYVVPSAPGRRFSDDEKVTDLLYRTFRAKRDGEDYHLPFRLIRQRFMEIASDLMLSIDIKAHLDRIEAAVEAGASEDFCASRGEYLNGLLLADYLGYTFVDPKDLIFFFNDGSFDSERTHQVMAKRLEQVPRAVIPGFYGSIGDGEIHTFSRGGSDVTGSIVARAAYAELYENWTDVNGFLMADPHIVPNARPIRHITYRELRELSYMGATVLHEDSVFPVHRAGIPTNIRNTNDPDNEGTMIMHGAVEEHNPYVITGIAGRLGFSVLSVEKAMMNSEIGFGRKVLQAVEENGLSFEHMPTGIDTMCVVLPTAELEPVKKQVVKRIMELTAPDALTIHDHMGIIATVGRGMVHNPGTAARLFSALSREKVNVRMIDQGSSELSILVGVDGSEFQRAIHAIYDEFVKE